MTVEEESEDANDFRRQLLNCMKFQMTNSISLNQNKILNLIVHLRLLPRQNDISLNKKQPQIIISSKYSLTYKQSIDPD